MLESKVQKKILNYLQDNKYVNFKVQVANKRGISDIIACSPKGKFIAIEVKAPGKEKNVSALQQRFLDLVSVNHGLAFSTSSLEEAKRILDDN